MRIPCLCRDCLVETVEGLCQLCRKHACDPTGSSKCHAPNAYALSAKSPLTIVNK